MARVATKTTRPVPRNVALQAWYRKKLTEEVRRMSQDTSKAILAQYKRKRPEIAQDESPAMGLRSLLKSLRYKWKNRFSTLGETVARQFTERAERDATVRLKNILKENGFTVGFKLTRGLNDILQATIGENVGLIKSIQSTFFEQIETIVMQAVKNGRDLGTLTEELARRYDITHRRAVMIARDQTNKATGAISRARTTEAGITRGKWVHIPGKFSSRKIHEGFNGKVFDLREGLYDSTVKKNVLPGEMINCNCSYRVVIPDTSPDAAIPIQKPSRKQKSDGQKTLTPKEQRIAQRQKQEVRPYTPPTKSFADYEKNADTLQDAAKAYFNENLKDTELTTGVLRSDGKIEQLVISFAGSTWQKIKEHMNTSLIRPRLVPEIAQILQGIGKEEAPYKAHKFSKFYKFEGVALGEYLVTIKVGERTSDKVNAVYSMTHKKASDASLSARQVPSALQEGAADGFYSPVAAQKTSDAVSNKISTLYEIVNIEVRRLAA